MERFVDLPTPLTPTMEMTYGRGDGERGVEPGEVTAVIERRISRDVVGVRILRREAARDARIRVSMPEYGSLVLAMRRFLDRKIPMEPTLKAPGFDANELTLNALTQSYCCFTCNVLLQ